MLSVYRPTPVNSQTLTLDLMMGIRIVDNFDDRFTLTPEAKRCLFDLLHSEIFLNQVAEQLQCDRAEFTGLLFQPVPYSPGTPKGMPAELEPYYGSPDHAIINVPPNFMFKAKIFNPSRLCAIYRKLNPGLYGESLSA
ncbi:MAG: hypothetical protein ACKO24_01595 [Leptolyngbyaceae cyanobacterium]